LYNIEVILGSIQTQVSSEVVFEILDFRRLI
jgi:hypothetical protein